MKALFLSVLFSVFIASCGRYQPLATAYTGSSLSKERIAVLMGDENSEYFVTFLEYTNTSTEQTKNYVSGLEKQPLVVHMLPGKYLIKLECLHRRTSNISVNPFIKVNIKAGMTYELQCQRAEKTKNKIIAYVINTKETQSLEIPFYLK